MGRAPKAFCGVVMPVEPSVMVFMVGSSPQAQYIHIKGYHLWPWDVWKQTGGVALGKGNGAAHVGA